MSVSTTSKLIYMFGVMSSTFYYNSFNTNIQGFHCQMSKITKSNVHQCKKPLKICIKRTMFPNSHFSETVTFT